MRVAALSVRWSITLLHRTRGSKYLLSAYPHMLPRLRCIIALLAAAEYQNPLTFKQAMSSDYANESHAVCQYEINTLAKNQTWDLVDLPTGRKAVKLKLVFMSLA
jgi:hypothetical protein